MVNRYGHCASYTTIEELETELAFSSLTKDKITPPEMKTESNRCTGLAYDNYDRFVETSSGKDTLHDTVCIAYQRLSTEDNTNEMTQDFAITSSSRRSSKRRRAFVSDGLDIEPYHKKPRITSRVMIPIDDARRKIIPNSYLSAKTKDTLWMLECCYSESETAMWVGWISLYSKDSGKRKSLLSPPNQSITYIDCCGERNHEERAQKMARECDMASIPVTHDLSNSEYGT